MTKTMGALQRAHALCNEFQEAIRAVKAGQGESILGSFLHASGGSTASVTAGARQQIAVALKNGAQAGEAVSLRSAALNGSDPGVVQLFTTILSRAHPASSKFISTASNMAPAGSRAFSTMLKTPEIRPLLQSASPWQAVPSKTSGVRSTAQAHAALRRLAMLATPVTTTSVKATPVVLRKPKLWRRIGALVAVSGVGGLVWVAGGSDVDQIERRLKTLYVIPTRLTRNIVVISTIIADYLMSLYGVAEGTARESVKHECHERCADRLQKLFFKNGGIYIKLGQHIGQLDYLLPEEYVRTMRESMLNKCPVSTYDQISKVIERELGVTPEQAFAEFDPLPLASASLAQVHKARTHDGQQVAVKIQHTHLTDTASADTATVAFFVRAVKWAFPEYDYSWLVAELQESLPRELDFIHEGQNAQACARNFRTQSPQLAAYVAIPDVHWELTTTKVLTMEYMEGVGVTDVEKQQELGIDRAEVARLVSDVFAAMIFHHGFIHCDPHGGNMLVRVADQGHRRLGKARPQLVLLDHGLYRQLDEKLRGNYAALWKSLVLGEEAGIRRYSTAIAGEDMYVLFASVLTMRPWDQVTNQRLDHLVMPDDPDERVKLQGYAAQFMKETTALLARLPRVVLLLLKTNDCLRSVDLALGTPVNSFVTTARECTRALSRIRYDQNPGFSSLARGAVDKVRVELRVMAMKTLALYEKLRASLISWGALFGNKRTRASALVDEAQLAMAIPKGLPT